MDMRLKVIDFEDLQCLKKLLTTKKLTEKQKKALRNLIQYYYSTD